MSKPLPVIASHFPYLTDAQSAQLEQLAGELQRYNDKVNLISRRDVDNIEVAHLLHSLAIAKFIQFEPGSEVLDLGTGGGLPGLPLAIMFPDTNFHLIDRIGKKIDAARHFANVIGLKNVSFQHGDSGECHRKFDFVVSRAVMSQLNLIKAVRKNISAKGKNSIPNGLIALKGGDLNSELAECKMPALVVPISDYFSEPFFETKKIIYTKL